MSFKISEELYPLVRGLMMSEAISEETEESLVESYIILNELSKRISKRLDTLKDLLHHMTSAKGSEVEKGHLLESNGHEILRRKKQSSAPNSEKLRALMKTREVPIETCFETVPQVVLNVSKLNALIELDKLNRSEVDELRDITWSIEASPSKELKTALSEVFDDKPTRRK